MKTFIISIASIVLLIVCACAFLLVYAPEKTRAQKLLKNREISEVWVESYGYSLFAPNTPRWNGLKLWAEGYATKNKSPKYVLLAQEFSSNDHSFLHKTTLRELLIVPVDKETNRPMRLYWFRQ